ncbi:MAG: GNAT family N-acetyltransferase, partial [Peptostreptococcaceae bacterium]
NKIDQWQNGYPNNQSIESDIEKSESYVLEKHDEIIATAAISFNGESTYDEIHEGKWISNDPYAVIHRVAVSEDKKGNGVAGELFNKLEEICTKNNVYSIKIDTHRENKSMQRFLEKHGYKYCGVIYLLDKNERVAFEKNLK